MKRLLPITLGLALLAPALHADDPAEPACPTDSFRIEITRVTANRDLFPLAFPTPSRVNGILDELAVLEQNAPKDRVKITLTRFPTVTTHAGGTAVIITGRETPNTPVGKQHHSPVYRNRILATPYLNKDGSISVPCRVMDTRPDPDFGSVINVSPTIKDEVVSGLLLQSGDTGMVEAGDNGGRLFFIYYATVTILRPKPAPMPALPTSSSPGSAPSGR